jgi:glutaredoxin 3
VTCFQHHPSDAFSFEISTHKVKQYRDTGTGTARYLFFHLCANILNTEIYNMKYTAIATIAISTIACAAAFTTGKPAFSRGSVSVKMSTEFIDSEIASNDVVIFSKSYCPFCKKTKVLFEDLGVDAKVYELNQMDDGADIQSALLEKTGQNTVPNVFIKGEHIGGNDDCQGAAKAGSLQEKLGL